MEIKRKRISPIKFPLIFINFLIEIKLLYIKVAPLNISVNLSNAWLVSMISSKWVLYTPLSIPTDMAYIWCIIQVYSPCLISCAYCRFPSSVPLFRTLFRNICRVFSDLWSESASAQPAIATDINISRWTHFSHTSVGIPSGFSGIAG